MEVCSPPKRKRAQETVRIRTFSNDAGKLGTSELEQPTGSSSFLTSTHLADIEHQILPQDSHERANKCSIVQTGSGCEALMKQPSFFDSAITEFLNGNGIIKARTFATGTSPSQSFSSVNNLSYHTPMASYATAAAPSLRAANPTECFPMENRGDFKPSGCSPFRTAASMASDDTQSPISTPFRFTSFPASLPKINPKVAQHNASSLDELPSQLLVYDQSSNHPASPLHATPANRYVFSSKVTWDVNLTRAPLLEPSPTLSTCLESETCSPGDTKAVDVSRDSTISSISPTSSPHSSQLLYQPPLQNLSTPLDFDPSDFHKVASGGDWNDEIEHDEEDIGKSVSGTRLNFNSLLSPEAGQKIINTPQELDDSTLLIQNNPVEMNRSFSSDTQQHYGQNEGVLEPPHPVSWMQIDLNWPRSQEKNVLDDSMLTSQQFFESQLESSQVSPIRRRADSHELSQYSSLGGYGVDETHSTQTPNFNTEDLNAKEKETMGLEKSYSIGSFTTSPIGKPRKIRPMPDMSAFDGYSCTNTKLSDDKHSTSFLSLSSAICPPTPMLKLTRRKSANLQLNKVLIDCNQSVLDGTAVTYDCKNADSLPSLNPSVDLHRISSVDDEYDEDIANANFGQSSHKVKGGSMNELGVSFSEDFINLGIIGSGAFADVFKVRCRTDDKLYAIKRRRRKFFSIRDRDRALKEVKFMLQLQFNETSNESSCPFLLKMFKAWQEEGHFYCQTELCCRDNCHQLIHSLNADWQAFCKKFPNFFRHFAPQSDGSEASRRHIIPESAIWKICHDVAAGLSHIHSCGIVHLDIKPCNIFFYYGVSEGCLCRIGDFGLAAVLGTEEDGQEGDTAYMALEVLSSNIKDTSADIFSLGMTLYELSSESNWSPPTEGSGWREIRGELHNPDLPEARSQSLRDLVKSLISPDHKARPTANSLMNINLVKSAGSSSNSFLEDYVKDVNHYEIMCERQLAAAQREANELRKTPTSFLPSHSNTDLCDIPYTPGPTTSADVFDCRTLRR